jgi:hypothetical protein
MPDQIIGSTQQRAQHFRTDRVERLIRTKSVKHPCELRCFNGLDPHGSAFPDGNDSFFRRGIVHRHIGAPLKELNVRYYPSARSLLRKAFVDVRKNGLYVGVRRTITNEKQRMFAEVGEQLRAQILLSASEMLVIFLSKDKAGIIGHASMNFEDLASKNLSTLNDVLTNDRLILRKTDFEKLVVVRRY